MKIGRAVKLTLLGMLWAGAWSTAALARDEVKDVRDSVEVVREIMTVPEKAIPPALLKEAKAIVVIPDTIKGAFIVGGRHGTGVALVRQQSGQWSAPIFVTISGASFGWQIGGKSTDLILVFKSLRGVESLLKGKFTLGADASIAAGPVGRTASAATDVQLKSEILSYSRSRGVFGGVALAGSALLVDKEANTSFYGKGLTAEEIISGKGTPKNPSAVKDLQQLLERYSS